MTIEQSIKAIQKSIIQIKKDKKMFAKLCIIEDLIKNDEWEQDRIEKIRDNRDKK